MFPRGVLVFRGELVTFFVPLLIDIVFLPVDMANVDRGKTQTGLIVKWAILGGFFLFFTAWFLGGYIHAKYRLKKGKPLLAYHRVRPCPLHPFSHRLP